MYQLAALLEDLPARRRHEVVYVALCFPTPRDASTDRAASLFHEHINLSPDNKYVITPAYIYLVLYLFYMHINCLLGLLVC